MKHVKNFIHFPQIVYFVNTAETIKEGKLFQGRKIFAETKYLPMAGVNTVATLISLIAQEVVIKEEGRNIQKETDT